MNTVKRLKNTWFLFFLGGFSLVSFSVCFAKPPAAVKGIIDLQDYDFKSQGIASLDGEWKFFWNEWIDPHPSRIIPLKVDRSRYINVPSSWNNYQLSGMPVGENGYATYELTIKIPKDKGPFALYIPEAGTAYTLFVDGKKLKSLGVPGKSKNTTTPRVIPEVFNFSTTGNPVHISIWMSNYHHRRGGLWESIHLGPTAMVYKAIINKTAFDLFFFGVILIMGIYHLGIYFFRKKELTPLFFSGFCFLVALRVLVVGDRLLLEMIPHISTPFLYKVEYLTFYLGAGAFFTYLYHLYPKDCHRKVFIIFQTIITGFTALVLFSPMPIFTKSLKSFQIFVLVLLIYMIYVLILALKNNRTWIKVFMLGFLIFALTVVNDILYTAGVIKTLHLFHMGMFIFILFQSYIITQKFSLAFQTIDDQRDDLNQKNQALTLELTKRKQAERSAKQSELKYRQLTELLPGAVFETDLQGKILFANKAAEQVFGWKASNQNQPFYLEDGLDPSCKENFKATFSKACFERAIHEIEVTGFKKGSTSFPAVMFLNQVCSDQQQPVGVRGVAIDLTSQKNLEKRIRNAEKIEALGTLAGGIAHDFNNILSIIMGYTELIQFEAKENDPIHQNLEAIVSASMRARDLTSQILSYSRQDQQAKEPVDINPILKAAVSLLKATIPTNIEINEQYLNDDSKVNADPTQIHQIILNFATNAVDAMKQDGGRLSIKIESVFLKSNDFYLLGEIKKGAYICLTFEDTGSGIDKEIIDRIFEPFFTTKELGSGTGMGLSVIQGIVKQHHGNITVKSSLGKGTAFSVYLPVYTGEIDVRDENGAEPIPNGSEKILFVDDEKEIATLNKKMLTGLGYRVTAITSSVEALEFLSIGKNNFDLLITDMAMPKMTGLMLASKVKVLCPELPIILCTGYSDQVDEDKARKMGIEKLCYKPIIKRDIGREIRKILDKP